MVLKNALKEVMIHALGIWNAKLVRVPAAFVISMEEPNAVRPGALFPKPIKAGVPARPPAIVVSETGMPEEKGRMAPEPAMPVGPTPNMNGTFSPSP